jgi:hypothetical protein
MEFTVSNKEVTRRKAAYVALVISLFVGLFLFSKLLNIRLLSSLYLSFIAAFFLLGVLSFRFLNLLRTIKIRLSDQEIERLSGKLSERFLLSDIERINIKRRSSGAVREIYIFFRNHKHLYISAFEQDFDDLASFLVDQVESGIPIREIYEPINFDHLIFYPTLGLAISFCFVCFLKVIIDTDNNILKYYELAVAALACSIAVFFAYWKPIARRSGEKNVASDYILAITMFILSIYVFNISANL